MESTDLTRLERIANSLPCRKVQFERCAGPHGEIYFAYGQGDDGKIYGLWGHCGVAMTIDFEADSTLDGVRQTLVDKAHESAEQMYGKVIIPHG